MSEQGAEGGPDRQPTEGGSGTAEVEDGDDARDVAQAGGEQKETERSDEL